MRGPILQQLCKSSIELAQDSLKYANEMLDLVDSAEDLPHINGVIKYLETARRRSKEAIQTLKQWRVT